MTDVLLADGYRPGAIGAIVALHGRQYSASHGFDHVFEAKVARRLGEFLCRYQPERDRLWLALRGDSIVGSLAIDGSEQGGEKAHLRWFILGPEVRGLGVGRRMMDAAMEFCRERGFESVYLWTLEGLDAAMHLYERAGFRVVERLVGTQWGKPVVELRLELRLK